MQKRILTALFIALFFFIHLSCSKKAKKDMNSYFDPLFSDGFESSPTSLFNLLDPYPALKSAMKRLEPKDFNRRMNEALKKNKREEIIGALTGLKNITVNENSGLRETLQKLAYILRRIRTNNPRSYSSITQYLERLRRSDKQIIQSVVPITHEIIDEQYRTKTGTCYKITDDSLNRYSQAGIPNSLITKLKKAKHLNCKKKTDFLSLLSEALGSSDATSYQTQLLANTQSYQELEGVLRDLADGLEDANTRSLLLKLDSLFYKLSYANPNAKQGFIEILQGLSDPSTVSDKVLKNQLIKIIGVLGDLTNKKAGFSNTKSAETIVKELIYNLQSFATTEGSAYTSNDAYRLSAHSSRLSYVVGDMMVPLRALFANDPKYPMKTDKTVLSYLLDNLNSYETSNPELIDSTLQKLVALDFKGYDRSISASSISITALESLIFVLATAELFGYEWNNDSTSPKVTGMSGGAITVGDSLVSLRSRLVASGAGDTQVGMIKFLNDSAAAAKNGDVQMDGVNLPVDANTRALCLLQGESKGDVGSCSDTVYTKTIPWALGLISRVIFEGYGPYYNKNRTDGPLSLSGSNYKSSWTTSDFKIKVKDASFAGLGGTQNPSGNGSHYSITEIVKTDAERAVSSDEEAIFKNFMWLVHEKRMVLVIPVNAIMGTAVKDAAYITVVANGLSGLMDAKPCNSANTSCDKSSDNGKWRKAGTFIKPTTTVGAVTTAAATSGDLQTFSDTPGDSVLLVEAWGKDLTGTDPYGFSDALYPILWDLAFTENASPTTFYGAIPPALAKNFAIFERLGFLTENTVTPANTSTYWDKRNKLFPMVAALAKAFKSNTDNTIGQEKNAYKVLTDLAKVLVRPYIYEGLDWTGDSSGNAALVAGKTITTLRIDTASSSDGLRSPFMLEHNYYPNPKYRSLLSLLAEGHVVKNSTPNGRRYQDGLINLISQTNLASGIANLFNEFNKEARKTGKEKMISGLSKIFLEMKTTSESPQANQFNLQTATEDLEIRLRDYTKEKTAPDYTANKTFDYTWNGVDEGMVMVRDLFTVGSKYSIIRNIDNLLDILIDSQPTQAEAANLVEILSAVFADENGKQSSIVTDLIIVDSPKMLKLMAPAGHDTLGLMNTMTETGGFLAYLQDNLATPYTIADILNDAEQFLNSSIVQSKEKNKSSLIYSTGRLLEDFIPVLQAGKKFSLPGTYFEDSSNSTENADTAFDALNYLFSR